VRISARPRHEPVQSRPGARSDPGPVARNK
jgi:hypothetical protein